MIGYNGILLFSTLTALVHAKLSPNATSLLSRNHPRDILAKRSRDCGTFTMYCGGIPTTGGGRGVPVPMACANACYYINTFKPGFSTSYSSDTDNDANRVQSGCVKNAGSSLGNSVCNIAPFSQLLNDASEDDPNTGEFNCDEFPMAEMPQADFDPEDVPRNTLACIDMTQNSAAGNQLANFIDGTGWYGQDESENGGRSNECKGRLQDGDTYKVAFNYDGDDNFDKSTIPVCKDDNGNLLQDEDPYAARAEFYMTKLGSTTGMIDFPYEYDVDNRYSDGLTRSDIQQCQVTVVRNGDSTFEVDIIYGDGSIGDTSNIQLPNDGDSYTVEPPDDVKYKPLFIQRTAPIGSGDGTPIVFVYGDGTQRTYSWLSDVQGVDNTLNAQRDQTLFPSDVKGRYCLWTPVSDTKTQSIYCWFPCIQPGPE